MKGRLFMTNMYVASPAYTLVDGTKGSMTNRLECAKEHFKNNFKNNLVLGATGAAAGVAIATKPSVLTKAANMIAKGTSKLVAKLGGTNIAAKIMKNPTKFGLAGIAAAAGLLVVNQIQKHAYKAGQIDQKYTDAAKIETQTKNVVLA